MSFKVVSFNDTKNNNLEETHDIVNKDTSNIQLEMDEENYENEYPKPKIKKTRHPVSYDDILNSLGFGVSNGALYKNTTNLQQQPYYNTQHMQNTQNLQHMQNTQHTQNNNESLDPRIKNSPIYNKYFKNYKDPNEIQEPEIPLTPQQQRIKMAKDYIEYQQARKRISQIKSKKMFYSTQNISISNQQNQQNPVNLNKLFIFSNRK
jgi:hypothetical protein